MFDSLRKIDKDIYNNTAEDFIPIACHYNENTLLTKDGKLLQIIQVNGINSEQISNKLFNLREIVRNSIKKNITTKDFAFWIHTIRERKNLDDMTPYKKLLSANIHELWQKKNYWRDKFVNTLYISIVYDSAKINIKNFNSLVNSLSSKLIVNFENNYLNNAFQKLENTTNNILVDLKEFGAEKLGIIFKEDKSFSSPMYLYNRIANLSEDYCLVPIKDLSNALARNKYVISGDKIVVNGENKESSKYLSLLSIKEYQEIPSAALDNFLQLPIELIVTEIFYFIDKNQAVSALKGQDYILKVSGDKDLAQYKGLGKVDDLTQLDKFCHHQISISIVESDQDKLKWMVTKASTELFKLGIMHVKEDINIEQTFWAQLPGNFSFIRRLTPIILENIAAFAALHNSPLGNQYTHWGRALTLLRTEKGTPYFMNFHDNSGHGNTCIFGTEQTGKTILLNFLISESIKYDPTIIYLSNNNNSKIFIEAIEGSWLEPDKNIINPFLLDDSEDAQNFVFEFFKLITQHYIIPLTEEEISFLQKLKSKIFTIEKENRNLSSILKLEDFMQSPGEKLLSKLKDFMENGLYHGVFDSSKFTMSESNIVGINLYKFSEESFSKQFYPSERKYLEQFHDNLLKHQSVCAGIIYALTYHLSILNSTKPKIFAVDNLDKLYKPEIYYENINLIFNNLNKHNGLMISNFNFSYLKGAEAHILQKWLDIINTKIILPSDVKIEDLDKVLGLSKTEIAKLSQFLLSSRMFLINKDNESIVSELSIAALVGIVRILSSGNTELDIYKEILEKYQGPPDTWLHHLHDALNVNGM